MHSGLISRNQIRLGMASSRFLIVLTFATSSNTSCESNRGVQLVVCDDGTGNQGCCPAEVLPGGRCDLESQQCWTKCGSYMNGLRGHLICRGGYWNGGSGLFMCSPDSGVTDSGGD